MYNHESRVTNHFNTKKKQNSKASVRMEINLIYAKFCFCFILLVIKKKGIFQRNVLYQNFFAHFLYMPEYLRVFLEIFYKLHIFLLLKS